MKAMITALLVMLVIAGGSYAVLDKSFQKGSDMAYSTTGARITPGH